jgi:uncharacterized phage protein (TIGR02220 family)
MPEDKAGKLFMTILKYVNDLDTKIDDDFIVDLVFEPIKQQIERDLQKWEDKKEIRSESGSLGNLKRWHLDLYAKVKSTELNLNEAVLIAKGRKVSQGDDLAHYESQNVANIAVNVNDIVNGNVIKKDITNVPSVKTEAVDYKKFIESFNAIKNRKFRITQSVKTALNARLRDYTKLEIYTAIVNAHKDQYHIDENFKYLTPEFILRPDKLEKFLNANQSKVTPTTYDPYRQTN